MSEIPSVVVWFVSGVLVEAAVIDGLQLRVPNWLTFPFRGGGPGLCRRERRVAEHPLVAGRGGRGPDLAPDRCIRSAGWGRAMSS